MGTCMGRHGGVSLKLIKNRMLGILALSILKKITFDTLRLGKDRASLFT